MTARRTMLVAFRADASVNIGTGHVMRCLALADALRSRGAVCRFVCRSLPGNLLDDIRRRGFEVSVLVTRAGASKSRDPKESPLPRHAGWLDVDWRTDAAQALTSLQVEPVDWLVVDHYALDSRWERELRPTCRRLMVIDDLADRSHDCDLLLDQNLGREAADYTRLVPPDSIVLVGPKYALLRPEFVELRSYSLERRTNPQLRCLLITMGGIDPDNSTGKVLAALRDCELPANCEITVVMGSRAPWIDEVRTLAVTLPRPTKVLVDVSDMARLMADSDLAIGAAGSTSWERCALGLPSLLIVIAGNQRLIANGLASAGAAIPLHMSRLGADLSLAVQEVLAGSKSLKSLSACSARIVDGLGTSRVRKQILEA